MSSIASQICSHFSILNQNLTLNLRSLRSLYSQSQVSLVSSPNPSLTSLHTVHNQNSGCCCRCLSPHCPPWVKASHADGSASYSQDSQVYFLPFSSIFFSIWEYDFFPFKFMYISLIFSFLFFWGCFNLLIHKNEGKHMQMKERRNKTLGRMKKSTIGIDGEPLPI